MMEGLWRLLTLAWACHFLSCPSVLEAKIIGTPKQCAKARFVPGYNLAGEGFDIVKMERNGVYVVDMDSWKLPNGSCTLMENSYKNNVLQKLPLAIMDWRAVSKCKMAVSSKEYESSESLVNDSTSSVENNWKIGLQLHINPSVSIGVALGGTHSREASFAMQRSKQDKYIFAQHAVHCNFYRYRLANRLPLRQEFLESIKMLPEKYNRQSKPAYRSLIDMYGTHYITQVKLGGKMMRITAIRTCKASVNGLTETALRDCLSVETSASFAQTASLKAESHNCRRLKKKMGTGSSFSSMFSDHHSEVVGGSTNQANLLFSRQSGPRAVSRWLQSVKTLPGIVFYSLKPLHFLIRGNEPTKARVKRAIGEYILENALVKRCSGSCQVGRRTSARDSCACVCSQSTNIRSNCCPVERGLATLQVYSLKGRKLYGDRWTQTDGSVQVIYGSQIKRTAPIDNNDNPNWPERFNFDSVKVNMATQLKFVVYDMDTYWNSDLLGSCSFKLRQGVVKDTCMFKYGTFFFSYRVSCAPSLGGSRCDEYIPSPVSASLAEELHSRNGFLAGEQWPALLGMNHSVGGDLAFGFRAHTGD